MADRATMSSLLLQKQISRTVAAAAAGAHGSTLMTAVQALFTGQCVGEVYDAAGLQFRVLLNVTASSVVSGRIVFNADYRSVALLRAYTPVASSRMRLINAVGAGLDGSLGMAGSSAAFTLSKSLAPGRGVALALSLGYPADIDTTGNSWWGPRPAYTPRGNQRYFSPSTGSDSTGDGSLLNPFKTVAGAVSRIPTNCELILKDATATLTAPLYESFGGSPVLAPSITIRPLTTCRLTAAYPSPNNDGLIVAWGGERDLEVYGLEVGGGFGTDNGSGTFTLHGDIDGFRIVAVTDTGNGVPNSNGNHWLYLSGSSATSHANAPRNILAQACDVSNPGMNQGAFVHSYQPSGYGATKVTLKENCVHWSGMWGILVDPDYVENCDWLLERNVIFVDGSGSRTYGDSGPVAGTFDGRGWCVSFWEGDSTVPNKGGVDSTFVLNDNVLVLVNSSNAGGVIHKGAISGGGSPRVHAPTMTNNRNYVQAGGSSVYQGISAGAGDQTVAPASDACPVRGSSSGGGGGGGGGGSTAGTALLLTDARITDKFTAAAAINAQGFEKVLIQSFGQKSGDTSPPPAYLVAAPNNGAESVTGYGAAQASDMVNDTIVRADTGLVVVKRMADPDDATKWCFEHRTRPDSHAGIRSEPLASDGTSGIYRSEFTGYNNNMTGVPFNTAFVAGMAFRMPSGSDSIWTKNGVAIFEFHNVNGGNRRLAFRPSATGLQCLIIGVDILLMTIPRVDDQFFFIALQSKITNANDSNTQIGYGIGKGGSIVKSAVNQAATASGESAPIIPFEWGIYDYNRANGGSENGPIVLQSKGVAVWRQTALAGQPDVTIENAIASIRNLV